MKINKEYLIKLIKEEIKKNFNENDLLGHEEKFENMLYDLTRDAVENINHYKQKYKKLLEIKGIYDDGDVWTAALKFDNEIGTDNIFEKEALEGILNMLGENKLNNINEAHISELEKPFIKYMTKILGWSKEDTNSGYKLKSPDGKHIEQYHWGSDAGIRTSWENLSKIYSINKHDFRIAFLDRRKLELPNKQTSLEDPNIKMSTSSVKIPKTPEEWIEYNRNKKLGSSPSKRKS